jgi:sec-independent protein translocase protein TatA
MLILALIVLLLFGNRLPSVMRSLGRGVTEFKKGVAGMEDDIDDAVRAPSKAPEVTHEEAPKVKPAVEVEAKKTEV